MENKSGEDKIPQTLNDRLAGAANFSQNDYQVDNNEPEKRSLTGYKVAIGILTVILVALSLLYFNIHRQQQSDYNLLCVDRDSIHRNLTVLISDFDDLQTTNDELQVNMEIERNRADSIITALQRERSFNYSKLKQYEREVGTLRTIMRGYLQQIDSLNNLNQQLISENVTYKKKISTVELRAEEAEERAKELDNRVREGARLRAQNINITSLNDGGREVSRVKRADRLSVNFTLVPNELTVAGNKEIYVRITSPDGYVLTTEKIPTFNYNGEKLTYSASREVDYQNTSLAVSIFFAGEGFVEGLYGVELYHENYVIGSTKVNLR